MQKFLFIFLFLIIGLFGALIITPNFINWNEYRDSIVNYVYTTTGHNLEIRGDIKLEILPSPALLINAVHVANIEGAMTSDTLSIKTIEVRMALLPLLGRQFKINTINLIEPVLNIEILMNGRDNIIVGDSQIFSTELSSIRDVKITSSTPNSSESLIDEFKINLLSLSIDNIYVQNGSISYRDNAKAQVEKIEKFNGSFSLASSLGPMEGSGTAIIRGVPINYSMATGSIVRDSTLPFNFILKSIRGNTNLHFSGALVQIGNNPKVKGRLKFNSKNIAKFVGSVEGAPSLFKGLNETFSVQTAVVASTQGGIFSNIMLNLGVTKGTGEISFKKGKKTDLNIRLAVNKIDFDSIQQSDSAEVTLNNIKVNNWLQESTKNNILPTYNMVQPSSADPLTSLRSMYKDINASLDISIASLIYNKAVVRQVKVNVNVEDQEIIISQASALLPGSTDLGLQGIIFDGQKSQRPIFDGTVDITTNNLRHLLSWAGINFPRIPGDRLRKLTLGGKILADEKKLSFNNILAQIDSTIIKGKASVRLSDRMLFDANLAISKLNLDGYLSSKGTKENNAKRITDNPVSPASTNNTVIQINSRNLLFIPSVLKKLDANISVSLNEVVFKNLPIKKIIFNAKLNNSSLDILKFEVADVAGLSAKISGKVNPDQDAAGLINPIFKDLNFFIRGKNLARALNFMRIKPVIPISQIGPVQLSGTLNGDLNTLNLLADLSLLGGRFILNGTIKPLSMRNPVQAQFSIFHPNIPKLVKRLGINYRLQNDKIGGFNLSGKVMGNLTRIGFSTLSGKIGNIKIDGILEVDLTKQIPWIDADLKTSTIVIDDVMPVQHTAFISRSFSKYHKYVNQQRIAKPRIIEASHNSLPQSLDNSTFVISAAKKNITQGSRWLNKTIDISFLHKFSGDIKLRAKSLQLQNYQVDDVDLGVIINTGILDLKRFTGNAYDGTIELDGKVVASKKSNQFQTRFKIINVNTGKFLRSTGTDGFQRGALDVTCEFKAFGNSEREIVNALSGGGVVSVRGLGVAAKVKTGSAMSGVAKLFISLQQFSNTVLGKNLNSKRTNFNTSFTMAKGVASFKDMTLKTGLGNGSAQGLVDFPNWKIKTSGQIQLSQNILTQVIFKRSSEPIFLPFKISGGLNDPSVKLETSEITKGGIRLPNILNKKIDKLKQKKGINAVLEKFIPKLNPGSPDIKGNPIIKTEDFFKKILKELIN